MADLNNVYRHLGEPGRIDPEQDHQIPVLARLKDTAVDPNVDGPDVEVELLNIGGNFIRNETVERRDLGDILPAQRPIVEAIFGEKSGLGVPLINFLRADNGGMQATVEAINDGRRFESSAWFERDRAQVSLTDRLSGKSVIELADEELRSALQDGFLKAPRVPRASDSDWLEPLIDYARSTGAFDEIEITPQVTRTPKPKT